LYSATPESIALYQAEKMNCKTIVDGFCGVSGNAIAFAMSGAVVYTIEKDKSPNEIAKHNAKIYFVSDKIKFIHGDFFEEAPKIKAEGIFLDPSWGGPEYRDLKKFKLLHFNPMVVIERVKHDNISEIVGLDRQAFGNQGISKEMIESQINLFPEGAFVAKENDKIVGIVCCERQKRKISVL